MPEKVINCYRNIIIKSDTCEWAIISLCNDFNKPAEIFEKIVFDEIKRYVEKYKPDTKGLWFKDIYSFTTSNKITYDNLSEAINQCLNIFYSQLLPLDPHL